MSKMPAPKLKADYVAAIAERCGVPAEELAKHTVDRLKEVWAAVRPPRPVRILPAGWKKANLDTLRELYVELVVPDLNRSLEDRHWNGWKRSQYLLEIEIWMQDHEEEREKNAPEVAPQTFLCPACRIPMMRRTNGLTGQDFYGCLRFPTCKKTLSLTYGGQPTEVVQKAWDAKEKMKKETKVETVMGAGYGKRVPKPLTEQGGSSVGSWTLADEMKPDAAVEMEPRYNMNLTKEEMAAIIQKREESAVEMPVPK